MSGAASVRAWAAPAAALVVSLTKPSLLRRSLRGRPLCAVAHGAVPVRRYGARRMPETVYLQRDQPAGVPPLSLTGERTLPDVPEENYWYQRHLVVYEWIAARTHGRRIVDLACGEGYGSGVLGAHGGVGRRRRRQPGGVRARAPEVHLPDGPLRARPRRDLAGRRRLRRVPADDRARAGSRRGARARQGADRARGRRLHLDAERADARAQGRDPLRQPVARDASTGPRSTARCASATSPRSTCSGSRTRACCARTSSRSSTSAGMPSTLDWASPRPSTTASRRPSRSAISACTGAI